MAEAVWMIGLALLALALAVLPPLAVLRSRHAVDLARWLAAVAGLATVGTALVVVGATSL